MEPQSSQSGNLAAQLPFSYTLPKPWSTKLPPQPQPPTSLVHPSKFIKYTVAPHPIKHFAVSRALSALQLNMVRRNLYSKVTASARHHFHCGTSSARIGCSVINSSISSSSWWKRSGRVVKYGGGSSFATVCGVSRLDI